MSTFGPGQKPTIFLGGYSRDGYHQASEGANGVRILKNERNERQRGRTKERDEERDEGTVGMSDGRRPAISARRYDSGHRPAHQGTSNAILAY